MIATSNTSKSTITNSSNPNNSNQEWNNVGNSNGNASNNHFNGSNSNNMNTASNNSNSSAANPSNAGYGSKFEFDHWIRIPLDPIRAACLRYVKTFSKVEQSMGNRVFFQFDSEGIILRAQDKTTLAAAQKQFLQLSRINQIELLTSGIDQEDYRQVIMRDIKTQGKYGKCFVQLIPYDAFRGIAMQLKNFGYEEPLRQYEKYMKLYPKFAFLLCHEAHFAAVKQELLRILKGNGENQSQGQSQYKEKGNNDSGDIETAQKGKKYESTKNLNISPVQYVKKEESKESKEKSAIKKWEELADEGKFSDKEQNGYEDYEEEDEMKQIDHENEEQDEDLDDECNMHTSSYRQEWEQEQQRIQEYQKMSNEEKQDNFSGLLMELSKTISQNSKDESHNNNVITSEQPTNVSNNSLPNPCEISIIIQDCQRVNVSGLCIAWLLLSQKIAEEQLNIRIDKQSNIILEGIDRQLAYELSSIEFIGADSSDPTEVIKSNEQFKSLPPGICLLIVPSNELSDYIQDIKNEDLKRACQCDFMVFMKDFPDQNSFFVLFSKNLQKQGLLQPPDQQQQQQQHIQSSNQPIEPSKQAEYYSTYPSFNIKECRLIEPINKSQTAFLVAYRKQLFCLKIFLRLSDRQLHGTLANFEEHFQSENQQLLRIYAVSVHPTTSKQFSSTTTTQGSHSQNGSSNSLEQLQKLQQLQKLTQQQQSMQQQQQFIPSTQMQLQKQQEEMQQFVQKQQQQQQQQSSKNLQEQSQQSQQAEQYWDVFVLSEWKSMNLKQAIDSKKYFKTFSQTIAVAIQLAIAVKNLHEKEVHHGNLKLSNVLFDGDFNLILADIAQEYKTTIPSQQLQGNIEKQQQNLQAQQQASSSQIYQAPELLKGVGAVGENKLPRSDIRSDIWSLGILFDDIFQAFPYFSKTEQSAKKKNKKSAGSGGVDYSQKSIADVKALIAKCHAKNPFARPHINEVLQELKDIQKSIKE